MQNSLPGAKTKQRLVSRIEKLCFRKWVSKIHYFLFRGILLTSLTSTHDIAGMRTSHNGIVTRLASSQLSRKAISNKVRSPQIAAKDIANSSEFRSPQAFRPAANTFLDTR